MLKKMWILLIVFLLAGSGIALANWENITLNGNKADYETTDDGPPPWAPKHARERWEWSQSNAEGPPPWAGNGNRNNRNGNSHGNGR